VDGNWEQEPYNVWLDEVAQRLVSELHFAEEGECEEDARGYC
jgi:hypothetical protein